MRSFDPQSAAISDRDRLVEKGSSMPPKARTHGGYFDPLSSPEDPGHERQVGPWINFGGKHGIVGRGTQEVNRDVNIGVVETECGQGRGVSSEGAWTSSMGGSR